MVRDGIELSRWFKSLIKYCGIYHGDPTTQELELLNEVQGRVRLVTKTRWILLALLCIYGLYAGGFYYFGGYHATLAASQILVLLGSLALVAAYNIFYRRYYRQLSHFLFINHIQILLDMLFVTLLIHFSGGVMSWFWTVYLIITLEASFLLERKTDVWLLGGVGGLIYGTLLMAEFQGMLPHVQMPFTDRTLPHDFNYVMIEWFWVAIMNATMAIIGAFLMGVIRGRERELKQLVIKDQMTNLYNRSYFFKMLNSEIQRSLRYNHVFSVILLDIDDFKRFNDSYGHLEGDLLLKAVAEVFRDNVRRSEKGHSYDIDIPCRYGGEEFAIILPETPALPDDMDGMAGHAINALAFAERIRIGVASLEVAQQKVTVSIGVAAFPEHGETPDALVKAADDALYRAKRLGKNLVVLANGLPAH